jgi:CO/xanthine dehydrogenase Mo-binding subunit
MAESTAAYKVIGTRPVRPDGADKVTGRAIYGADMRLTGMLHGKVLRSPHAHARIRSIDTSKARALPGVKAVVTARDMPKAEDRMANLGEMSVNVKHLSNNALAYDKVLYRGHAVAAVAATNVHVAEEALKLIEVDYEVLPAAIDVLDAMKDDAPILHEDLKSTELGEQTDKVSNVVNHFQFKLGEPDKGFEEADVVIEREFDTATVHQGYIEPHTCTVHWRDDGRIHIRNSTQGPFNVRDATAQVLDVPLTQVKLTPQEIGGGFGGKIPLYLEPVAALLSKKTGRPVKMQMSRTETFEATGPTAGAHVKIKMGANRDGTLVAADAVLIYEAGAFPGSPVAGGAQCMMSAYDIPNAFIEGYDIVVNRPKTSAYRAPGSPAAAFAMETAIDEVCEKIGMDPIDFRLLNSSKEGVRRVTGPLMPRVGFIETLEAAKAHPHYSEPLEGPYRGRGVASGFWGNNTGPSSAVALVQPDGKISLTEGSPDIGGTRSSVSQQMAEVLGIPVEDINPNIGDTDSIGFTSNTGGSGVTFKTGFACYTAAQDIKQQMIERAAKLWEVTVDDVEYVDGVLQHKSDPELRLTFQQMAARQNPTGGPIVGSAGVNPGGAGPALGTHIVDLEVDPDTGKVTILRYTALQDAGKAIHPSYVEGQIQGGVAQGIGWALNEEYFINDQGHMVNSSFLDYRMPTSLDLPMIDTCIVEVDNPNHPYGVRGVGEVPIVPPMAAIANAIYDAIGVRLTVLPMNPGNVLEALWEKNGS